MIFRQMFEPVSSTYTYLLASRPDGEALIIDPVIERVPQYLKLIEELDLKLVFAVDTHTHADHVTGLGKLRDGTGCATLIGEHSRSTCVTSSSAGARRGMSSVTRLTVMLWPGK